MERKDEEGSKKKGGLRGNEHDEDTNYQDDLAKANP